MCASYTCTVHNDSKNYPNIKIWFDENVTDNQRYATMYRFMSEILLTFPPDVKWEIDGEMFFPNMNSCQIGIVTSCTDMNMNTNTSSNPSLENKQALELLCNLVNDFEVDGIDFIHTPQQS
jgi:hypothetical protein